MLPAAPASRPPRHCARLGVAWSSATPSRCSASELLDAARSCYDGAVRSPGFDVVVSERPHAPRRSSSPRSSRGRGRAARRRAASGRPRRSSCSSSPAGTSPTRHRGRLLLAVLLISRRATPRRSPTSRRLARALRRRRLRALPRRVVCALRQLLDLLLERGEPLLEVLEPAHALLQLVGAVPQLFIAPRTLSAPGASLRRWIASSLRSASLPSRSSSSFRPCRPPRSVAGPYPGRYARRMELWDQPLSRRRSLGAAAAAAVGAAAARRARARRPDGSERRCRARRTRASTTSSS